MTTTTIPDGSTQVTTPVANTAAATATKKAKKGGYGKYASTILMTAVVLVVYWEETGLNNLFEEDDGPSELTWKDDTKLWNQEDVLFNDAGYTCRWISYKSAHASRPAQMCVHPEDAADYISSTTAGGNNKLCAMQTKMWDNKHAKQVYLEVGAHIGVCVMEMLLSTKATVIAVESHPKNLFCLTSTLLKNPKLLERVSVLPVAAGSGASSNAAMTLPQPDKSYDQAIISPDTLGTTEVVKLDDVFYPGGIQVTSINTNGYECNVMDGAVKLLKKVVAITFTVNPDALPKYGCSDTLLLAKAAALSQNRPAKWYRESGRLRPLPNKKVGFNAVAKNKW
jgi:FkbM family methyltransferase